MTWRCRGSVRSTKTGRAGPCFLWRLVRCRAASRLLSLQWSRTRMSWPLVGTRPQVRSSRRGRSCLPTGRTPGCFSTRPPAWRPDAGHRDHASCGTKRLPNLWPSLSVFLGFAGLLTLSLWSSVQPAVAHVCHTTGTRWRSGSCGWTQPSTRSCTRCATAASEGLSPKYCVLKDNQSSLRSRPSPVRQTLMHFHALWNKHCKNPSTVLPSK